MNKLWMWFNRVLAEMSTTLEDFKHRNDPPLPPVPCQICGKPGHIEKYCPHAKALGYFGEKK